jgi:anaerobic selenocysteine-containing dehydrogenase
MVNNRPMSDTVAIHHRTCHLCEAMCGVEIRHRGSEIVSIRGDRADPFSRGHICPKALAIKDVHEDPDRLRRPVRREGDTWREIPWDEALDETAERLLAIQRNHGSEALASYFGNPQVHSYSGLMGGARLLRALRTRNRYSATSVDQLPHHLVCWLLYGHQLMIPIPDLDRTQFLLVLGANPVVSNGSLMTAPDVAQRLKALRARGGRLVVVDPRRTETAAFADTHLFVRPGSDALLLLALLQVIFAEGLSAPGRLTDSLVGLEALRGICDEWTPERVAGPAGIDAAHIRQLAREFAASSAAVCYGRMGVSTQAFGALSQWLIQLLNIVTGNLDREGGAMFTSPALDTRRSGVGFGTPGSFAKRKTRVRGLPEFSGEYPVAALAEEILTPGKDQIRGLVTVAGNPVLSTPNGRQLSAALEKLEFMVSIDFYTNETTRHASLILPPTFALERDHFDLVFHMLAIRNTVKYCEPLFPGQADQRHDWEICEALASRLESLDPARRPPALARLVSRWLTPKRSIALGIRTGERGAGWNPLSRGLTLRRIAREPHGIDLGPLQRSLPQRLWSRDKRIDLVPALLRDDLRRLAATFTDAPADTPRESDRMSLIGRRDLRTNNSWLHNSQRMVKGPPRCTLQIHPTDAALRSLNDGEMAVVRSRTGTVRAAVEVTDALMPGVVSLPHGWGHALPGVKLRIARAHAGVSANDLTDERYIDALSGNAALNGVNVWVTAETA